MIMLLGECPKTLWITGNLQAYRSIVCLPHPDLSKRTRYSYIIQGKMSNIFPVEYCQTLFAVVDVESFIHHMK